MANRAPLSSDASQHTESESAIRSPLTFYVLFHDACEESAALARHLFRWFRLQDEDGSTVEAGLPIWYRCRTRVPDDADAVREARLDPPIEWSDAERNVVVVLGSDKMVQDPNWRAALAHDLLDHTGCSEQRVLLLPVAVDESLYRLQFLLQEHQAVRIGAQREETAVTQREASREEGRIEGRARVLRRQVMEIAARAIRSPQGSTAARPESLRVFISHAKRDGRLVAESVRDQLARYSQMKAWYDANELPPGSPWKHPMEDAAQNSSAALLSVVSDAYATRFWCRKEVRLAREPLPLTNSSGRIWTQQPVVGLLLPGHHERRPMVQLNRVVHLCWPHSHAAESMPEGSAAEALARARALNRERALIETTVDRLVLEVLLDAFYRRLCEQLHEAIERDKDWPAGLLLAFVPDPWSLRRTLGRWRRTGGSDSLPPWIAYPGLGLRSAEIQELHDVLDDLLPPDSQDRPRLLTLEELSGRLANDASPGAEVGGSAASGLTPTDVDAPIAVLSAGGRLQEMVSRGASPDHANDLLVRLSLVLLRSGWRLSYGGTLGNLKSNTTRALLEVARGWMSARDEGVERDQQRALDGQERRPQGGEEPREASGGNRDTHASTDSARLNRAPLINYAAWPHHRHITTRTRAGLTGLCHFEAILPPNARDGVLARELKGYTDQGKGPTPHARVLAADALSRMRQESARDPKLRIVVGGKLRGWSGWLPGIAEELLASLQRRAEARPHETGAAARQAAGTTYLQPFVILGGFGGCAGEIADYLLPHDREDASRSERPDKPWPHSLSFAAALGDAGFAKMLDHGGARAAARRRFDELAEELRIFREHLLDLKALDPVFPSAPTLTRDRFTQLLGQCSPTSILHEIRRLIDDLAVAEAPSVPAEDRRGGGAAR